MTAGEIRNLANHDDMRLPTDPKNTPDLKLRVYEMRLQWAQMRMLGEIAAQLAELNDNLKKLAGQSHFERIFGK